MARLRVCISRIHRPPPALVIACLALFVALGGTGYAAVKLSKNSVGTKQLKQRAVTPPKLSAAARDLLRAQKGDTGDRGTTRVVARKNDGVVPVSCFGTPPAAVCNGGGTVKAGCDPGERLISGSWGSPAVAQPPPVTSVIGLAPTLTVTGSAPDPGDANTWAVTASYGDPLAMATISSVPLTVHVVCAS